MGALIVPSSDFWIILGLLPSRLWASGFVADFVTSYSGVYRGGISPRFREPVSRFLNYQCYRLKELPEESIIQQGFHHVVERRGSHALRHFQEASRRAIYLQRRDPCFPDHSRPERAFAR